MPKGVPQRAPQDMPQIVPTEYHTARPCCIAAVSDQTAGAHRMLPVGYTELCWITPRANAELSLRIYRKWAPEQAPQPESAHADILEKSATLGWDPVAL